MTNEDLLYRFFSNSLTEAEEKQFNELLETDADFKAQFEFENNLKRAIKHKESKALKAKLIEFEHNLETNKSKENTALKDELFDLENEINDTETINTSTSFNWRIAASVVILLGASWFGYQSFFGVNYENLYDANYQEYPNTEFAITRSDTIDSPERKAFVAYEAQDYKKAAKLFESLPLETQKPYHTFYKAQSYLKTDNITKAKMLFKNVVAENVQFVAESHWYLAMVALQEKDKESVKKYLRLLTENYDYNKVKAEALLKDLN